jgi:sulfhydrogenase subunit beta (sulfur reductase)
LASSSKSYIVSDLSLPDDLEIKNQYFSKRQKIFSYNLKTLKINEHIDAKQKLVLIRPCDAIALEYIDKIMLEEPVDLQYKNMRETYVYAVVNCLETCENGFCVSTGGSLINNGHGDLELTPLAEDKFFVEIITTKGEAFAKTNGFKDAAKDDLVKVKKLKKKAIENHGQEIIKIPTPEQIRSIPMDEWRKIASGCLGCGFCNYACPTCTCYTESHAKKDQSNFSKIRVWDACIVESFNLMAGGHTIMPNRSLRFKRRFSHKFEIIPEGYGMLGCSGCGRCYQLCPAHFDMKKILAYLAKKGEEYNE